MNFKIKKKKIIFLIFLFIFSNLNFIFAESVSINVIVENNFAPAPSSGSAGGGGSSRSSERTCRDEDALNYSVSGRHKASLCSYEEQDGLVEDVDISIDGENGKSQEDKIIELKNIIKNIQTEISKKKKDSELSFSGIQCPKSQIITQNIKSGDRNGKYSSWERGVITEAKILQSHLNRLGFASGKVDGILGPISEGAIKRMQKFLGTKQDGWVGRNTRSLLNKSCKEKEGVKIVKDASDINIVKSSDKVVLDNFSNITEDKKIFYFSGIQCPKSQIITQNIKSGDRNGKYSSWERGVITEAKILQSHLNRLGFASGKVDGILGSISEGAIKRMQKFLGTKQDGWVGRNTRSLLNKSCKEKENIIIGVDKKTKNLLPFDEEKANEIFNNSNENASSVGEKFINIFKN